MDNYDMLKSNPTKKTNDHKNQVFLFFTTQNSQYLILFHKS
jgi:hypothetical protein